MLDEWFRLGFELLLYFFFDPSVYLDFLLMSDARPHPGQHLITSHPKSFDLTQLI